MKADALKPGGELQGRQVRLKRRRQEGLSVHSSLFARLAPSLAVTLHADALDHACIQAEGSTIGTSNKQTNGWSVLSASQNDKIEFLPLAITFESNVTIYVSYNGGDTDCDGPGEDGILDLPISVLPDDFVDDQPTMVQIMALSSIQDADILMVEPLTCDDWELLEIKAAFLESGALLQQISVVYAGQTVPLWVGAHDVAKVRVLAENFGGEGCLRLVQNTRISVVPKPRPKLDPISPPLRILPTAVDYSEPMNQLAKQAGNPLVFTTPGTAFVNPAAKDDIAGFVGDKYQIAVLWSAAIGRNEPSSPETSCLLQIAFSEKVPKDHIAIHYLTRARLKLEPFLDFVHLRVLSPIEVLRGSSMLSDTTEETQQAPMSLIDVEPRNIRTGPKWRYPNNVTLETPKQLASDCGSHSGTREPMDNGSLWVSSSSSSDDSQQLRIRAVCIAAEEARWEEVEDRTNERDRCFVFREDLERDFSSAAPDLVVASKSMDVPQTPQLINLLPETYVVPSSLQDKMGSMASTGDALVIGDVGSGKTVTALLMAALDRLERQSSTVYLDCKRLKDSKGIRMKNILSELTRVFQEALASRTNSTIILDDLDELAPNLQGGADGGSAQSHQVNPVAVDQAKLIGDVVRRYIERHPSKRSGDKHLSVVITFRDKRSLASSIVNARPFTRTVDTPNLAPLEKERLLWRMLTSGAELGVKCEEIESTRLGRKCEGFRPQDLHILASKVKQALQRQNSTAETVSQVVNNTLEDVTPLRKLSGNDISGAVEWADVGGLFEAKEALTSTILNPAKYRRIYDKAKIRLPRGVLLFGCPGNGKSFLVPALAKKCGFSLITCRGPEILDRYIGASESKVRELFARAAASSPAILFFDELDSLAPRRGSDRTGVTDRVVNQLLTLLDGVEDSGAEAKVYIVAATSRPDIVDPALLRPGRLEKHIYVGYPESEEECNEVLLKIAARYSLDEDVLQLLSSGHLVRELKCASSNLARLSAADFKAAFDTAQLRAIHQILRTDPMKENVMIGRSHLFAALRSTKPSLPERDYAALMAAYTPYRKDPAETGDQGGNPRKIAELRTALR